VGPERVDNVRRGGYLSKMHLARSLLLRASRSPWLAEQFRRRRFARRAVRRFMPGEDSGAALDAAARYQDAGIGSVITALGERVETPEEAAAVRDHYLELLEGIEARDLRAHVSVKLTHLGLDLDPDACLESLLTLAARAGEAGSFLWLDMEESHYVDRTLTAYRTVRSQHERVGICLQTYLRRTPDDIESLLPLSPAIRLVKGAYDEPAAIAFSRKRETDAAFLALAERLLEHAPAGTRAVFGTHDLALIEGIRERVEVRGFGSGGYEVHMLYGIGTEAQRDLAAGGVTVRVLISYGEHWFPWYMRRLAERPANVWFVMRSLVPRPRRI